MKANLFMPKYVKEFACIGSECIDTCCAGWDINIDEDSYNRYEECKGSLKILVKDKYTLNRKEHDFFNHGYMVLKEKNKCPFLNEDLLCDIHGNEGEEHLCITCKSFPRSFNIVDGVYEKSLLPSCEEACRKAFLNKEKMEFIELEEDINEEQIEIRRFIDIESVDEDSLLQYFWELRVISINIMQMRTYTMEERFDILKKFYNKIDNLYIDRDYEKIEDLIDMYSEDINSMEYNIGSDKEIIDISLLFNYEIISNIKSFRLMECINEYNNSLKENKYETINEHSEKLKEYNYIFENYIVNQIFKDLIPFNTGNKLEESIQKIYNCFIIVKSLILGISLSDESIISEDGIIRVIQSLSKEVEHSKSLNNILSK